MTGALTRAAELGVDWWTMRIVVDPRIPDGLAAMRCLAFADVFHAHLALDALDAIEAHRRAQQPGGTP